MPDKSDIRISCGREAIKAMGPDFGLNDDDASTITATDAIDAIVNVLHAAHVDASEMPAHKILAQALFAFETEASGLAEREFSVRLDRQRRDR